jgi:hypothetical protein
MDGQTAIQIKDQENLLTIPCENLVNYHGREFIGGVALAFQLLRFAFDRLSPHQAPQRREIELKIAVNGPGIIDGIEMVTRACSRGKLVVEAALANGIDAPDAADGLGGRYYFELTVAGQQLCCSLKPAVLPEEFIALARKTHDGSISTLEQRRLQTLKEEIAEQLLSLNPEMLFDIHENEGVR